MSDDLKRHLAPITPAGWAAIEEQARDTLTVYLAARKLVDFTGPLGWQASSVNSGRTRVLTEAPADGIETRLREVQPLVELRVPFSLSREELDTIDRGNRAPDLDALVDAARRIASAEDRIAFGGLSDAGVRGLLQCREHEPLDLGGEPTSWTDAFAQAVETLRHEGVAGPYAAALGPGIFTGLTTTILGGHTAMDILRKVLDGGPIVWAPTLGAGAVVLSRRGGDFELVVGRDLSIGYQAHDRDKVDLYLQESVTFRLFAADAAVVLEPTT